MVIFLFLPCAYIIRPRFFYFLILFLSLCGFMHMNVQVGQSCWILLVWSCRHCEMPDSGAGNQAEVPCKSRSYFYLLSHLYSPRTGIFILNSSVSITVRLSVFIKSLDLLYFVTRTGACTKTLCFSKWKLWEGLSGKDKAYAEALWRKKNQVMGVGDLQLRAPFQTHTSSSSLELPSPDPSQRKPIKGQFLPWGCPRPHIQGI